MGLEKIASGVGKFLKATGNFIYETGKGFIKGVGKAVYETGKGAYKGITKASNSYSNNDATEEGMDLNENLINSSVFFKELKTANLPIRNYNNLASLVSGKSYNNLSDADRIEKSLGILDRMYMENYINKRVHKKLKKSLYYEFEKGLKRKNNDSSNPLFKQSLEDYLPLAASFLFLFSGALFLTPNPTGLVVINDIPKYELNFFGVICFAAALSLLLVFLRKNEKKK